MALPSEVGTPATGTNNGSGNSLTLTISHTLDAEADCVVIFTGTWRSGGSTVDSVTYDGVNCTREVGVANGNGERSEIWYILSADLPSAGTYDVVVTTSATSEHQHIIAAFKGVHQTNPFATNGTATTVIVNTNISVSVSSATDELLVGTVVWYNSNITDAASHTRIAFVNNGAGNDSCYAARRTGNGGATTWAATLDDPRTWSCTAASMQGPDPVPMRPKGVRTTEEIQGSRTTPEIAGVKTV